MIENEENNLKQSLINNNNNNNDSSKELSINSKTFSNSNFLNSKLSNSNFTNSKFSRISNISNTKFSFNKSIRYKIGISFFILYLTLNSLDSILISYFDYDFKINVFGEIYLRLSFLFIFIFLSVFFPKTTINII